MSHFGIDLHGTIDSDSSFFYEFMEKLVEEGHTVSVMSGSTSLKILKELKTLGLYKDSHYHNLYSIQDFLHIENHVNFVEKFNQNKQEMGLYYNAELWNATKAILCNIHKIDFFIDNEVEYLKYFGDVYYQNGGKTYHYDRSNKFVRQELIDFLENKNMQ